MRATVDVDQKLLDAARQRAEEEGTTLAAFVESALSAALGPAPRDQADYKFHWKAHRGRLLPGIDIADRESLFDAMDGRR